MNKDLILVNVTDKLLLFSGRKILMSFRLERSGRRNLFATFIKRFFQRNAFALDALEMTSEIPIVNVKIKNMILSAQLMTIINFLDILIL